MSYLDIKQEYYLPFHMRMIGLFLSMGSIYVAYSQELSARTIIISVAFMVIGILMLTTRYGLRIDITKRTFVIYSWIFGLKIGKPSKYDSIQKFYINQVTENTTMTFKSGSRSNLKNGIFKAFMLLDNGEKVHVDSDRNENELTKRLENYVKLTNSQTK
ncbi:MAG: hypothetical protein OCD76_20650 [Reichenbachiella sp.]